MKKMFLCLAATAAFVFAASTNAKAGENLLTYVPEKSEVLIYAELASILQLPMIKDLKKENDDFRESYDNLEKGLKEKGLKLEDLIHSIAVFSMKGDNSGAVFTTSVSESKLKEILSDKGVSKEGIKYKEAKMNGKNVLIIETPVKNGSIPGSSVSLEKQSVLTYLKKNLVLLTEKSCFGTVVDQIKKSNITKNKKMMAWKKDVSPDSLVWAMFDFPPKPKKNPPQQPNPTMGPDISDSILGGMLSLSLSGKDKKDITLDVVLDCKDEKTSRMMAMQAQFAIGGGAMAMCNGNPELAMEVSKAIVINPEGKKLKVKLSLPKTLQDKIKEHAEKMKNAPQQAAPGGMPGKPTKLPDIKPSETGKK